jgi:SNW domain-containing protein 1
LESNQELKKQKFEQERDILGMIALGVHTGHGGGLSGDVDARLYNQTAGMDLGFGADDVYNAYSKPLFDQEGVTAGLVYRPTRGEMEYNADEMGPTLNFNPTGDFWVLRELVLLPEQERHPFSLKRIKSEGNSRVFQMIKLY